LLKEKQLDISGGISITDKNVVTAVELDLEVGED